LSSVEIKSVDAKEVRRRADEYARELFATQLAVEEVIVFGSFANNTYAPGSDLDLFIVLNEANERLRERVRQFLPTRFPVPVDVFPFTRAEMEELRDSPLMVAVRKMALSPFEETNFLARRTEKPAVETGDCFQFGRGQRARLHYAHP
jgi:predicted nucleotidyltransferase